jgi:pyridoxal phosphate enzyme (YggS family)
LHTESSFWLYLCSQIEQHTGSSLHQITSPNSIEANLEQVRRRIAQACQRAGRSPEEVTIVAVTKGVTTTAIQAAFQASVRHFGESRVQEAQAKREQLLGLEPRPTWHLLGHLQTNKIGAALRLFDIIHSVDSIRLAEAISQHVQGKIPILLEVNIAGEATKGGFLPNQLEIVFQEIGRLPGLEVKGLMTVAPQSDSAEAVRPSFREMRRLAEALGLAELSMGMSDDFEVAVEEGATMVRLGRIIFGQRQ